MTNLKIILMNPLQHITYMVNTNIKKLSKFMDERFFTLKSK